MSYPFSSYGHAAKTERDKSHCRARNIAAYENGLYILESRCIENAHCKIKGNLTPVLTLKAARTNNGKWSA